MSVRRLCYFALLAPPFLGGCGAVSQVRTAFEMPVAPTPSARELARARQTHAFDSLSRSLSQLNSQTLGKYFSSGNKTPSKTPAPKPSTLRVAGSSINPARTLAQNLTRGTDIPLAPRQVNVSLAGAQTTAGLGGTGPLESATIPLPPRTLRTPRTTTNVGRETLDDFLKGWDARESLRRSDNALIARRSLEDRIAQQARATRSAIDLSLVPPETQLELTNLRLQLVPLLSIPAAKRTQAQERINAIEQRLNDIWAAETARQNALLQQSLVDIPAQLRREGEQVIAQDIKGNAEQSNLRLAQVRNDFENRLVPSTLPGLGITQPASIAPNARSVRAVVSSQITGATARGNALALPPLPAERGTIQREGGGSNKNALILANKNERVWDAATR